MDLLAAPRLPNSSGLIPASGEHEEAIRGKGDLPDMPRMAPENSNLVPADRVPQAGGVVPASGRNESIVGRKSDRTSQCFRVALKFQDL